MCIVSSIEEMHHRRWDSGKDHGAEPSRFSNFSLLVLIPSRSWQRLECRVDGELFAARARKAETFGEQAIAWLWSWLLGLDAYD